MVTERRCEGSKKHIPVGIITAPQISNVRLHAKRPKSDNITALSGELDEGPHLYRGMGR